MRFSSTVLRNSAFSALALVAVVAASRLLIEILSFSFKNGYGSYCILIPAFSAYIVWSQRQNIFRETHYDFVPGLLMMGVSISVSAVALSRTSIDSQSFLTLELKFFSLLFWISGAFVFVYGRRAMKEALFPFALLALSVPLPPSVADRAITALQAGSTAAAYSLFSLLGTPVYRDGFLLYVPGVTIEVAKECSGINSSIALIFTLLVVGYETLHTTSRRLILVLLAIPLSFAKNALRIVTLTLLAIHVDPRFLTGSLHHKGGIVFYLIGLAAVYPIWKLLQRSEIRNNQPDQTRSTKEGIAGIESRETVPIPNS